MTAPDPTLSQRLADHAVTEWDNDGADLARDLMAQASTALEALTEGECPDPDVHRLKWPGGWQG